MGHESTAGQIWDDYRLPQMWDMVKDEDGVPTHQQVGAWQKMAALCADQADQLQKALDRLMAGWPPNPGSAAEVFKGHVDLLIWSMRDSASAASANVSPLIDIVMLLSQAKSAIGALMQKQDALLEAEQVHNANGRDGTVHAPPTGWRETLDKQARAIMATTDFQVGQAGAQIKSPSPYKFNPKIEEPEQPGPKAGTRVGGQSRVPVVPLSVFDPPAQAARAPIADGQDSVDPVLDGEQLLGATYGASATGAGGTFVFTPAGVVLTPDGVIGGPGAPGNTGVSASATTADQAGRNTSGASPMMVPPMSGRGTTGARTGRGGVMSGGRRRRRSDPEDPWAPSPGGPSVLEPEPEPEPDCFDPGPNVIGIDR